MPFIILTVGIIFLLLLIVKFKLNTFVSLIITAALVALGLGMNPADIATSIETGIGGTLGELAIVFGMGAMLGRLVADAGGAFRIAETLIQKFGRKRLQLAVMVASFIIGIALFFEVGMVLLIPIVFAIAMEASVPLLYLGIPMATALSVTHGFLPPHPAPTAIAVALGANPGKVLIFGLMTAVVAAVIAGPLFTKVIMKIIPEAFTVKKELTAFGEQKTFKIEDTPSFGISTLTSLFPVILMAITTAWQIIRFNGQVPKNPQGIDAVIEMIGNPVMAILISLIVALFTMGYLRKRSFKDIAASIDTSTRSIAGLLLVIGGGAAFKQVLIDGGVGKAVADVFQGVDVSPIILAWVITVILRIALGSATVAALTAAGLVMPLMQGAGIDPTFMVLSIGAGSLAFSHVNDAGFWMFKEYFDLNIKQTFQTWTLLETIISVVGLGMALFLNMLAG